MNLKRKKVSLKEEQQIITNMITSTSFVKQTKGIIKPHLFKSPYARIIASWVSEYYDNTGQAPALDIQDIYIRKRKEVNDEEEVELLSEFLQKLSDDWDNRQIHNTTYEVKNTVKYLKLRQLEQLKEQLEVAVLEGTPEQGENALANFKNVKEAQSTGVDLFSDTDKIANAFTEEQEKLFHLQGDLGIATGAMCRGDFVAVLGAPKSTKSFALWHFAHRASLEGYNVVVANFEMTESQYLRRAWQSFNGEPLEGGKVELPYFKEGERGLYEIAYRNEKKKGVDLEGIKEKQEFYKKRTQFSKVRILTFTSGVNTFSDVEIELANMEYYENFKADVVVFDYADIMASEVQGDKRNQLDDIWVKIRGLATDKNCLCVTASQVNAQAWGKDIKGKDADENKKKAAHVTKMFAINSTDSEMEKGFVRVQSLYEREGKRHTQHVVVLQSLEIGRWYLDSKFRNTVNLDNVETTN